MLLRPPQRQDEFIHLVLQCLHLSLIVAAVRALAHRAHRVAIGRIGARCALDSLFTLDALTPKREPSPNVN